MMPKNEIAISLFSPVTISGSPGWHDAPPGSKAHGLPGPGGLLDFSLSRHKENPYEKTMNLFYLILATDGDFNVGVSSTADLVRLMEEKRELGIYLTIIGLGMVKTCALLTD